MVNNISSPTPFSLIRALQDRAVDPDLLAIHRRFLKLDSKSDNLNASERWMMNFYGLVGTLDAIWIATAIEQ